MGMHNERIVLGEDDEALRGMLAVAIQGKFHIVIATVGSFEELSGMIKKINYPTLGIFDNRMPAKGDGEKSAQLLQRMFPGVKIISFASERQTWGDDNIEKPNVQLLLSAIEKI